MASLRKIKKDIEYLFTEVISDCWTYLYFNKGKNEDKIAEIINDAIDLRNDLFKRINHYDRKNARKTFQEINSDLLKGVDELFVRVSKLNEAK
ncbi:MAG TPA: hypothetical protein PLG03_03225 [Bacteroidales bacterium]|nr:hypothetical protein [Rikenellaceae bacterium]HON54545.1 hypothetical protein [Bacteroidales bacterium]HRR48771.1 hypothetical protein [Bacteroidales bacterium]HRT33521.1 hypothetical protein [Bacteroidales bacterium]HRT83640.1 hypothetical protein [Bacteroidales bacterium]